MRERLSDHLPPRLLVVARDPDLRRSLEFALAAEGYQVTSAGDVGDIDVVASPYDCTVVDHHVLDADIEASAAFCRAFSPVILLANHAPHPLSAWAFRVVLKPLLGAALSDAVHAAVGAVSSPT